MLVWFDWLNALQRSISHKFVSNENLAEGKEVKVLRKCKLKIMFDYRLNWVDRSPAPKPPVSGPVVHHFIKLMFDHKSFSDIMEPTVIISVDGNWW